MTAPDPRLDEIEARLAAVMPGPWELCSFHASDVAHLLAELRKRDQIIATILAVCDNTDTETNEAQQDWVVATIRAAVAAATGGGE